MNLELIKKRWPIIIILFFILASLLLLLTLSSNDIDNENREISSSFFASGSNKEMSTYESINFDATTDSISTEKISLLEFLKKDTTPVTEEITNPISSIDVVELKEYGNKVGELNEEYLPETLDEVAILNNFITEDGSTSARDVVLSLSERYINLSNELNFIDTPSSISLFHKNFVDVHETIGNALKTLSENEITGESLLAYNESPAKYIDVYLNIAQYLRASGVYFDTSEPGSLFTLPF